MEKWMSELPTKVTKLPITLLAIPGSHDSGSSSMKPELGVAVGESFVVQLAGKTRCGKRIIKNWTKTQNLTIAEQLQAGIRYLDLRVACRPITKMLHLVHGFYGPLVQDVLQDVYSFLEKNPGEIIILDFNHFYNMTKETHDELLNNVSQVFGQKCVPPPAKDEMWTLQDIWRRKYNVINIYHYSDIPDFHKEIVWTSNYVTSPWANTDKIVSLVTFLENNYKSIEKRGYNTNQFYVWQGVLTPRIKDIVYHICSTLETHLSLPATSKFVQWFKGQINGSPKKVSVCIVDFVGTSDYIRQVVELNLHTVCSTDGTVEAKPFMKYG